MGNLLKADLFRVLKTKIVYISLIIAVGLPLFVAGVMALSNAAVADLVPPGEEVVTTSIGDTLLGYTFNPVFSLAISLLYSQSSLL